MAKIIGIDLGTTNSAVAVVEGDKVRVIKTAKVLAPHLPSLHILKKKCLSALLQNVRLLRILPTRFSRSSV